MAFHIASNTYGQADAPTVILIHGVMHRQHAWDPVVSALSENWRVVTIDLPGHGASAAVSSGPNLLASIVDAVAEEIATLSPNHRPHLVGNSLGGYIALELGSRGVANGVTAISPAGFFRNKYELDHAMRVFSTLKSAAGLLGSVAPRLARTAVGRSLMFGVFASRPWRYSAENMEIDARSLRENTLLDEMPELNFEFSAQRDRNLPITVAWGTRDFVLPAAQRHRVADRFPQARIIPLRGLGHVPMSDNPARITEIIDTSARRSVDREARLAARAAQSR